MPFATTTFINALSVKKGTKKHADGWDASSKAWADVVLHLRHADGGFGAAFIDIT